LKNGLDVDQTEDAILRLKAMLWALEALRVVDDQLRESLEKVREGKEKMQNYIQQVSSTSCHLESI
jgi:gas vesicle protein